jgi:hypothetical protein
MQKKDFRTNDNFARSTSTRELHAAFIIPCVHDFNTQLCGRQAKANKMQMQPLATKDKAKARTEVIRDRLGGVQAHDR